jgi:hypothetical protein
VTYTLAPDCDACFTCAGCGRVVCADNEVVLCAHGDDPCCDDCCEREHG